MMIEKETGFIPIRLRITCSPGSPEAQGAGTGQDRALHGKTLLHQEDDEEQPGDPTAGCGKRLLTERSDPDQDSSVGAGQAEEWDVKRKQPQIGRQRRLPAAHSHDSLFSSWPV
jgi:hypothetical protein